MTYQLTIQEAFDKAFLGVMAQGEPSSGDYEDCRYRIIRAGKVLHCGVGHLLANDAIRDMWDNEGVSASPAGLNSYESAHDDLSASGLRNIPACFLSALQSAHDNASRKGSSFLPKFVSIMTAVANSRGLVMPDYVVEGDAK